MCIFHWQIWIVLTVYCWPDYIPQHTTKYISWWSRPVSHSRWKGELNPVDYIHFFVEFDVKQAIHGQPCMPPYYLGYIEQWNFLDLYGTLYPILDYLGCVINFQLLVPWLRVLYIQTGCFLCENFNFKLWIHPCIHYWIWVSLINFLYKWQWEDQLSFNFHGMTRAHSDLKL